MKKVFIAMCLLFVGLCVSVNEKSDTSLWMKLSGVQCFESRVVGVSLGIQAKYRYDVINPLRPEAVIGNGFNPQGVDVWPLGRTDYNSFCEVRTFIVNSLVEFGSVCFSDCILSKYIKMEILLFSLNTFLVMIVLMVTIV